jgi:hypothetical protein
VNAVEAMARTMIGLRRELRPRVPPHPLCPAGPTINIGVKTLGGVGYGVLPGHAEFWTDIRVTPGMTFDGMRQDIEAALARVAPETPGATVSLDISPEIGWVDATEVAADHPATLAVQAAAERVLGAAPPLAAFHGATDAWALQGIGGIPTIAAFGPGMLPLAHGPNEWVSMTALEQAAEMYVLAALGFGGGAGGSAGYRLGGVGGALMPPDVPRRCPTPRYVPTPPIPPPCTIGRGESAVLAGHPLGRPQRDRCAPRGVFDRHRVQRTAHRRSRCQ